MQTINLNNAPLQCGTPRVAIYTKANWSGPWVEQKLVSVMEARWATAPSFSTATLRRRFGWILPAGELSYRYVPPITTHGYYVCIVYSGEDGYPRVWVGYADKPIITERHHEAFNGGASGVQDIPCWGMDRALQYARVNSTVFANPDTASNQKWLRRDHPATFNLNTFGNRTKDEIQLYDIGNQTVEGHVFCLPNEPDPKFWSTREIIKYMARFHLPTNDSLAQRLPFRINANAADLPAWDRPVLNPDGKSLWDVLTELLSSDRMLGWTLIPNVTNASNFPGQTDLNIASLDIVPFTRLRSPLTLPSIGAMPANNAQITWVSNLDPNTDGELQEDASDTVEQVIVEGPREIAVGTFRISELQIGWPSALSAEYSTALSDQPGWEDLKRHEKARSNEYFRQLPKFADVFRLYIIKPKWDGTCDGYPLFLEIPDPQDENADVPYVPYLGNAEILPDLPLYMGVDYEGAANEVDETPGRQRLPISVWFEKPQDPGKYTPAQTAYTNFGNPPVQNPNALPWQFRVVPDNIQGAGFAFEISGAPKHALAGPLFTPNNGDPENGNDWVWGGYDYADMLITAAMRGDRRPNFRMPATVNGDLVRRTIIRLEHRSLEHVKIAAATVIGLDSDEETVTSDGGVLRDPLPILEALCRLAAESLVNPRKSLSIRTGRTLGDLFPGEMIATYNGQMANVIISEIRMTTPEVAGPQSDNPPAAMMSVEASTNMIDIVSLVGRVPEPTV